MAVQNVHLEFGRTFGHARGGDDVANADMTAHRHPGNPEGQVRLQLRQLGFAASAARGRIGDQSDIVASGGLLACEV